MGYRWPANVGQLGNGFTAANRLSMSLGPQGDRDREATPLAHSSRRRASLSTKLSFPATLAMESVAFVCRCALAVTRSSKPTFLRPYILPITVRAKLSVAQRLAGVLRAA